MLQFGNYVVTLVGKRKWIQTRAKWSYCFYWRNKEYRGKIGERERVRVEGEFLYGELRRKCLSLNNLALH